MCRGRSRNFLLCQHCVGSALTPVSNMCEFITRAQEGNFKGGREFSLVDLKGMTL